MSKRKKELKKIRKQIAELCGQNQGDCVCGSHKGNGYWKWVPNDD